MLAQVKQFKNCWYDVLKQHGQLPSALHSATLLKLPDSTKPIIMQTIKQAVRLSTIAALSKDVHVDRYNKIIIDSVAAISHQPGPH